MRTQLLIVTVIMLANFMATPARSQTPKNRSAWDRAMVEGVLLPYRDISVASSEAGIIREVYVKPGDRVAAGQPIAQLDSTYLLGLIRKAEAEANAKGKLEQAKAELAFSESKVEKLLAMSRDSLASRNELERAQFDVRQLRGKYLDVEESLQIAQLEVERLKLQLMDRTIVAPIDGVVTEINKQVGEFVAANSPNVARMYDLSRLKASFSINKHDLRKIKEGGTIRVKLDDGRLVEGKVDYVPPLADAESALFLITVVLENQDGMIRNSQCSLAFDVP